MKSIDTNEIFEAESSWISISSLKKAANISTIIENYQSEFTLPVDLSGLSEWKSIEKHNDSLNNESMIFPPNATKITQLSSYMKLLKKIFKLNEEIAILSQQLRCSNKEIERLNKCITKIQSENAIKLQFMQEQHERRLQKTKADLDFLLKDMNMKSALMLADQFAVKHAHELENLKEIHEKQIEQLKQTHESQLIFKEMDQEKYINELKQRFFKYLAEVEKKFKQDLISLKLQYNKELIDLQKETNFVETEGGSDDDCEIDFENESSKKTLRRCKITNRNISKLSISEFFDRASCESGASTRRESK